MDPFVLPADDNTSVLLYRPLRMAGETGDAPPWATQAFAGYDDDPESGPAFGYIMRLAEEGGSWLTHIARRRNGRRMTEGEYMVRAGVVTPLVEWQLAWPVEWWETEARPGPMLTVPRLPDWARIAATTAFIDAAETNGVAAHMLDDVLSRAVRSLGRNIIERRHAEPLEASTKHYSQVCWSLGRMVESVAIDHLDAMQYEAWYRDAVKAIRSAVGDAWFILRADPASPLV